VERRGRMCAEGRKEVSMLCRDVTIQEWREALLADIERFVKYWERQVKADPDGFSERMLLGDWDEQLACHTDMITEGLEWRE
jgi:hypothetical protein